MFKKISIATVRSARPLVATFTEDLKPKARIDIPQTARKQFLSAIKTPGFKAEIGEVVFDDGMILVGLGSRLKLDVAAARRAGAGAFKAIDRAGIDAIRCLPRGECDDLAILEAIGAAFAEGIALANWRLAGFDGTAAREMTVHPQLRIDWERKALKAGMAAGLRLAESTNIARTVAATPPNVCNPGWIAKEARKVARDAGLTWRAP